MIRLFLTLFAMGSLATPTLGFGEVTVLALQPSRTTLPPHSYENGGFDFQAFPPPRIAPSVVQNSGEVWFFSQNRYTANVFSTHFRLLRSYVDRPSKPYAEGTSVLVFSDLNFCLVNDFSDVIEFYRWDNQKIATYSLAAFGNKFVADFNRERKAAETYTPRETGRWLGSPQKNRTDLLFLNYDQSLGLAVSSLGVALTGTDNLRNYAETELMGRPWVRSNLELAERIRLLLNQKNGYVLDFGISANVRPDLRSLLEKHFRSLGTALSIDGSLEAKDNGFTFEKRENGTNYRYYLSLTKNRVYRIWFSKGQAALLWDEKNYTAYGIPLSDQKEPQTGVAVFQLDFLRE